MKKRILKLLRLCEKVFGYKMDINHGKKHIYYVDDSGQLNLLDNFDEFSESLLFNGQECSYNELINILTDDNPYILL